MVGCCKRGNEPSCSENAGNLTENRLGSPEELCCMEYVIKYFGRATTECASQVKTSLITNKHSSERFTTARTGIA